VAASIRGRHRAENNLGGVLLTLSDQQKVDHEILHVARDVAAWSREHVRLLVHVGEDQGLQVDPDAQDEAGILARVEQTGAEASATTPPWPPRWSAPPRGPSCHWDAPVRVSALSGLH
jgi:hypothetical protein